MKATETKSFISLSSNQLKMIAAFSMLLDHAAFLVFYELDFLRYIGRLALPIFAFFVAEGCSKTSSRGKYLLRMLILGVLCQSVYLLESIFITKEPSLYLNILFTLSASIVICCSFLKLREARTHSTRKKLLRGTVFLCTVFGTWLFTWFCENSLSLIGLRVTLDYGFWGAMLPLFGIIFPNRRLRIFGFGLGTAVFCFFYSKAMPYIWFSLFSLPLLALYGGHRGEKNLKYFFYLFYPLHLGALYLLGLLLKPIL